MANQEILQGWTEKHSRALGNDNLFVQHRMMESGLFSDENLIRILDKHPVGDMTVSTMGRDKMNYEWFECNRNGATGEQLLDVVKRGHLWINVMRLMDHHSDLRKLINDAYDELEARCPGLQATHRTANLLISSPSAIVYYHVDTPLNILWHLRGEKKCWVYPLRSPFVSQSDLEDLHAGQRPEDMRYVASFDDEAEVYEMVGGDMVTWAQNSPHRVENTSGVNISISTEHLTTRARRQINVHLANRMLRNKFGCKDLSSSPDGFVASAKVFGARATRMISKMLPATAEEKFKYSVKYQVDIESESGISCLEDAANKGSTDAVDNLAKATFELTGIVNSGKEETAVVPTKKEHRPSPR